MRRATGAAKGACLDLVGWASWCRPLSPEQASSCLKSERATELLEETAAQGFRSPRHGIGTILSPQGGGGWPRRDSPARAPIALGQLQRLKGGPEVSPRAAAFTRTTRCFRLNGARSAESLTTHLHGESGLCRLSHPGGLGRLGRQKPKSVACPTQSPTLALPPKESRCTGLVPVGQQPLVCLLTAPTAFWREAAHVNGMPALWKPSAVPGTPGLHQSTHTPGLARGPQLRAESRERRQGLAQGKLPPKAVQRTCAWPLQSPQLVCPEPWEQ